MKTYDTSLFLFTRDLRLDDNTGLLEAVSMSEVVIPLFVFTHDQADGHDYFSDNAFQFMFGSLEELDRTLRERHAHLNVEHGDLIDVIRAIHEKSSFQSIFLSKDYTPFASRREDAIRSCCKHFGIDCHILDDHLLFPPEFTLKPDGMPYCVFTPFFNNTRLMNVRKPRSLSKAVSFEGLEGYDRLSGLKEKLLKRTNSHIAFHGGRLEALSILDDLGRYSDYAHERDILSHDLTTKLSAHHKFGTVSIRETFHAMKTTLGEDHPLLRQLYWRDFFTGIAYHHPRVFTMTFQDIDETGLWNDDEDCFKRWCDGMTGFPLIDAGMRQLVKTGYIHNRLRMVTASFLTKDLHIDWRWGERFFANHLIDYDPSVNNANWQWVASTGSDAQPYFRIFNPWRQQKRFDPDGEYIRKWVYELGALSGKDLLDIEKKPVDGYPSPIIDHNVERNETLERFRTRR